MKKTKTIFDTEIRENQVSEILDRISDGFLTLDNHWRFTYLNSIAANMLGRNAAELIGKIVWEEFPLPKNESSEIYDAYRKAMAEQQDQTIINYYAPFDKWYENRIYPSAEGISVYFREITEQKKKEEKIKSNHRELRFITDNLPSFIAHINADFTYKFVNRSYANLFGKLPEDFIGKKVNEVLEENYFASVKPDMDKALAGEKVNFSIAYPPDLKAANKNFEKIDFVDIANIPEFDTAGNVVGLIVSIIDITERVKSETEKNWLLSILDKSTNGIYIFNKESLLFEYVNQGALNNLGYTLQEMQTLTPIDIKPEYTRAKFNELLAPLINLEKDRLVFETIHLRKDKTTYHVEVHLQLVSSGQESVFLAVIQNITARKKAEDEIKRSHALASGVFNSNMTGLIYWDANGEIAEANDFFLEMFGYSRQDLLNGNVRWNKMTPHEYAERDQQALKEIAETGFCKPYEKEYFHKDGRRIPILIGGASFEASGVTEKGVAYVTDITRAEKSRSKN